MAWVPLAVGPSQAYAHSPVPGIEGFYIGLLHPFSTPSQFLSMVGLALLVSSFELKMARWLLTVFLTGSLMGLMVGQQLSEPDPALFAVACAICVLAALSPGRLALLAVGLVGIGGYLIGVASIPDDGPTRDRLFTMSGSFVGANLGLLYLFGIIIFIRERYIWSWVGIAFRVVAAWVGTIALLMLALAFTRV
ncbi:MAG: HupE/UreJ family protein [Paracoccaceae bacterium]|nr:HupE/UreJ family protein [Paracoccaceae bacterium]